MKNITPLPSGNWRVRRKIGDTYHDSVHPSKEAAEKALARLPKPPSQRRHVRGEAEHRRQVATLPPFTSLRNVHRTVSGYHTSLTRRGKLIYGGHFQGEDALLRAVAKRDELEAEYPSAR